MIIDEIKKLSFRVYKDSDINNMGLVVLRTDIEKVLGEMKCEKCKWLSKYLMCDNLKSEVISELISPQTFYCKYFEVKDEN